MMDSESLKNRVASLLGRPAQAGSQVIFILLALIGSLFFQGANLYALLATQIILAGVLAWRLMRVYGEEITLRIDLLSVALLTFWLWLAVSVLWSQVPYISGLTFWWVGVLPLVYFIYLLSPDLDASWSLLVVALFVIGMILALAGLYQFIFLHDFPRGPFIYRNLQAAVLNMLILVLAARYLARKEDEQSPRYSSEWVLAGIFLLILIVGLCKSRGAQLCLAVGMLCLFLLARSHVPRRQGLFKIAGVFFSALTVAQIGTAGEMGQRLLTLQEPYSAGKERFLIWEASWKMLLEGPWYGRGLGTYWLAWPPYRPAGDASAGFYVHNDYLQIAIEGGWPALLLLLAILAVVAGTFHRAYRNAAVDGRVRIEMAGLVTALLTLFLHNILDFNLYSMPATILAGLFMGRLRTICCESPPSASLHILLGSWLRPQIYKICLLLLALFPMAYFITVGIAYFHSQKGEALIKVAELNKADGALRIAELLWPSYDRPHYLRASIYQVTILGSPHLNATVKRQLFRESEKKLRQAWRLNPWKPETFIVFARLCRQNPDLAGRDRFEKATWFYRHALAINPRSYEARIDYAGMLMESGDLDQAATVLKGGINHWYAADYRILRYYRLTSSICMQAGDSATADKVDKIIAAIVSTFKKSSAVPLERAF